MGDGQFTSQVADVKKGCCCPSTGGESGNLCFDVRKCCSKPAAGADVAVTSGETTVCSGTTDSEGRFCCEGLAFGSYDFEIDPNNPNYKTYNGSIAHATSPNSLPIVLEPEDGFVCGTCGEVIPDTLTLNDGYGNVTLDYLPGISTSSKQYYAGCAIRTMYKSDLTPGCFQALAAPCAVICSGDYSVSVVVGFVATMVCNAISLSIYLPIVTSSGIQRADTTSTCGSFNPVPDSSWIADTSLTCGGAGTLWHEQKRIGAELGSPYLPPGTTIGCDPFMFETVITNAKLALLYDIYGPASPITITE